MRNGCLVCTPYEMGSRTTVVWAEWLQPTCLWVFLVRVRLFAHEHFMKADGRAVISDDDAYTV